MILLVPKKKEAETDFKFLTYIGIARQNFRSFQETSTGTVMNHKSIQVEIIVVIMTC